MEIINYGYELIFLRKYTKRYIVIIIILLFLEIIGIKQNMDKVILCKNICESVKKSKTEIFKWIRLNMLVSC